MIWRILAAVAALTFAWPALAEPDDYACQQTLVSAHAEFPASEGWSWITTDNPLIVASVVKLVLANVPEGAFDPARVKTMAMTGNKAKNADVLEVGFFDASGCFIYAIVAPAKAVRDAIGRNA